MIKLRNQNPFYGNSFMQCFGVAEGLTYSDVITEGKLAGVKSMLHYTPPGAETIEEFNSRAMDFFCEICKYVGYINDILGIIIITSPVAIYFFAVMR